MTETTRVSVPYALISKLLDHFGDMPIKSGYGEIYHQLHACPIIQEPEDVPQPQVEEYKDPKTKLAELLGQKNNAPVIRKKPAPRVFQPENSILTKNPGRGHS